MAERFTTLSNLTDAIMEITHAYRNAVLVAIKEGVQEGAEIFVKEAEKVSPVDTGEYQKSWTIKPMSKARYVRYVGNKKRVKGKDRSGKPTMIPLINILEYSKRNNARPHVGAAINNSRDQIYNVIVEKIKKES